MKPTKCTLLFSIFITISLHISGNYVSIIRRTYCIYATLIFFTPSGLLVGMRVSSKLADQTANHNRVKNTSAAVDTVSFPDDGHIVARNM